MRKNYWSWLGLKKKLLAMGMVYPSLVPRPLFFLIVWGQRKKGLVDLQNIFCAARTTTFGDR